MPELELDEVARRICHQRGLSVQRVLGQGAFKKTYLVSNQARDELAFKVIRASSDPQRIARELSAMTRCDHPAIARLHNFGADRVDGRDYCWLIEEYLAGGTLTARIGSSRLSLADIRQLAYPLMTALEHLDGHGLVHRDIKPDNVMFRSGLETAVVVDFGVVRDLNDTSLTMTWAPQGPGTPFYSALEQLTNQKELIDWRTDQFSLGVVLAVCGYGHHPYANPEEEPQLAVQRVAAGAAPSVAFSSWAMDAGLPQLVSMVRPWPVQRYRTPGLLLEAWRGTP